MTTVIFLDELVFSSTLKRESWNLALLTALCVKRLLLISHSCGISSTTCQNNATSLISVFICIYLSSSVVKILLCALGDLCVRKIFSPHLRSVSGIILEVRRLSRGSSVSDGCCDDWRAGAQRRAIYGSDQFVLTGSAVPVLTCSCWLYHIERQDSQNLVLSVTLETSRRKNHALWHVTRVLPASSNKALYQGEPVS